MASRTQLRLDQLTGSFKDTDGGIVDSRSAGSATLASIALQSGSMVGIMSEVVSSIKRLHGAGSFAANAAGEFSQSITPATDDGGALGSSSKNWSDLFIADEGVINLGDDQDVTLTHVHNTGVLLNSTSQLQFNDSGTFIQSDADGKLKISSDGTSTDAINIDSSGGVDIDASDDIAITLTTGGSDEKDIIISNSGGGDSSIFVSSVGTGADALYLDASAGDAQLVPNLADGKTLKIGKNGAVEMVFAPHNVAANEKITLTNTAGTAEDAIDIVASAGGIRLLSADTSDGIKIGTGTSGVPVSIGHTTSEVTINDNLTVTGDLTVSGVTTTLDTTNLLVEDPIILLNKANSSANGQGGIAIENGGSSADLVFGRVANDTWGVGTKDTSGGTVTTLADMTLTTFRASKIEIDGANDHIDVSTDMVFTAVADITLAPGGANVKPNADSAVDLGVDGTAFRKLFVDDIDLNGQGRIDLDEDADTSIRSSADDQIDFEVGGSDLLALKSTGLHIVDDKKLVFGSNDDASFEYDEDGTDTLLYSGASIRIGDDTKLEFGATGDFSMEYDEDGVDRLLLAGAGVRFGDDMKLEFGAAGDATIEYDEDGDDVLQIAGSNVRIGHGAATELQFRNANAALFSAGDGQLGINATTSVSITSNFLQVGDGTDGVGVVRLMEDGTNGGNYVSLQVPAALGSNVTFQLPDSNGTDGFFLKTDGNGVLSYASATAGNGKRVMYLTSSVAAGDILDPSKDSQVINSGPSTVSNLDLSVAHADNNDFKNMIDVYVNGQMLVSGSNAEVGSGTADYFFTVAPGGSGSGNSAKLKFAFDLEKDDVVIVKSH